MTITGQKILSVYDPATGTVVQINHIAEDGEFEKKAQYIKNSQGNRMFSGHESRAEFLCYDLSGLAQLKTWMQNRTPVRFVTYGLDEHILWYEDTYITVDEKIGYQPYKRSGFRIYFEKSGGVHSIYKGKNILYVAGGWSDADNNEKVDNYTQTIVGAVTEAFTASNTMKFTASGPGEIDRFYYVLTYPISGAKLKFNVPTVNTNNKVFNIALQPRDYSLNTLAINQNTVINGVTIITPNLSYTHICQIASNDTSMNNGDIVEVKVPYLGVELSQYGIIEY